MVRDQNTNPSISGQRAWPPEPQPPPWKDNFMEKNM